MMKMILRQNKAGQQGAVSLFIVIFSALLITTITISFMQIMVKDQQQATYSDLSESAYDSAVAGVEDAKRALLVEQDCIGDDSLRCSDVRSAIDAGKCTTLSDIFGGSPDETAIVQTEGDRRLEQAYTCVKITRDTQDYLGSIDSDATATLIPLRSKSDFNKIVISWALSKKGNDITLPSVAKQPVLPLPKKTSWPNTHPALLRAQLINGGKSFHLSDFDTSGYSSTLFLYPSSKASLNTSEFALDGRRDAHNGEPQLIKCKSNPSSGEYACQATITIGSTIQKGSQTAFLNLIALYNATDYKIELRNGSSEDPILFDNVQPEVDSTGRANDLFRRVVSRVELNNAFNYPTAALETRNNICKNFSVTSNEDDYKSLVKCSPEEN